MDLDRRTFVKTGVAGGFATAVIGLSRKSGHAQGGALPLAGIYPLSGVYAEVGRDQDRGGRLALEEFGGKVRGREVEYIAVDDENNPGTAARKIQSLIETKGLRYIAGAASSSIGLAVSQVAGQRKSMYWTSVGADDITGAKCNKYTFRWSLPTYGAARGSVPGVAQKNPGARRWYTLTPAYVFGDSLLKNEVEVFKQLGLEHIGNASHPLGEREFSGHITKILAAKADVVVANNFAGDTVQFLKQAREFGLTKQAKVLVVWGGGLSEFKAIGADTLDGVYVGTQFWHDIAVPLVKDVSEKYRKKYNESISYVSMSSYIMVRLILEAIERAKSDDLNATVPALEGWEYNGPTGKETVRALDHQVVKAYFLLRGKKRSDMRDPDDFFETVAVSPGSVPPPNESECKIGTL